MATPIEKLIDDLERSYEELQKRMSDPAVYGARNEAAYVGRRLKELEPAYKLAQEWRQRREDAAASLVHTEPMELTADSQHRLAELEEDLKLDHLEKDQVDHTDVLVEYLFAVGDDVAAIWA